MTRFIAAITLSYIAISAAPASAQVVTGGGQQAAAPLYQDETRFTIGAHLDFTEPKEEFRENVGSGFGGGAFVRYNLDRRGILSLRLDGSWAAYGREKKRVPLSNTVGGRILVDVVTTNSLFTGSLGAQLTIPTEGVQPYVNVALAGIGFTTTSSVSGSNSNEDPFASTDNYEDGTGAMVYGAGLNIPVARLFGIDIGARYFRGGEASYLREGSIVDNNDGTISITPLQSRTPFLLYYLGVSYRFERRGATPCARALC